MLNSGTKSHHSCQEFESQHAKAQTLHVKLVPISNLGKQKTSEAKKNYM